ncbi:MAG: UDP-N-acetylenolpyruvoylglucosamine reductase [Bacteroidetes bacterium RIFCSPLOWO2_12_FULL_35_15]|nr:MAG: UDP-N-acetylenolpyruvoylglucosamine reductase [Bacteroidetes bacterium RIFCSPLOWO2_12_FULL_35_15]
MNIHENISLKKLNTFGIDASARYYAGFSTIDEVCQILSESKFVNSRKLILGGGSNLLFTKDFDGIVLKNNLKGIELVKEDVDHYFVRSAGGEVWHELVMYCIANNYAGLENLSLIPGNVGASPMQNIGAYGAEIKDTFYELEALHIQDKTIHKFNNAECKFGYRESVFKGELKDQFIITSVTFKLYKKPIFNTSYGAIEKELEVMGIKELSIKSISDAVCAIRKSKLPNPAEIGNAGSFFKNPEVIRSKFEALKTEFSMIVGYDLENGNVKLAAGWLIEQCGWKGQRFGDAGVHKLQALVLVNYGNANGSEILELSQKIIASVKEKFDVDLVREVNIV